MESENISTLSKLIRMAVDEYIKNHKGFINGGGSVINKQKLMELSHALKEPLTTIKGFSQFILKSYQDKLDNELMSTIKNIFDQSLILEKKINELLNETEETPQKVDILIIEDDLPTVKLINAYLSNKGYTIKGVMSGLKGLEELKFYKPKLILLDIILPDMSGSDVCKTIKSDEKYKDIPIYFLTAIPLSEVKKRVAESNANGYILKPFDLTDFDRILENIKK
ncbi:MAG: response regulator [Promethearchaeia archaeon]